MSARCRLRSRGLRIASAAVIGLIIALAHAVSALAQAQPASDLRVADLVQAGKITIGLGLGNRASAMKDAATGQLRGVAVDLARALAARIGVALDAVVFPRPGAVFDGAWDATFLVLDPDRTALADATPAYMQSDFTLWVAAGSPIHSFADADRPGIRIAVPRGDAVDLRLSRIVKQASLVRVDQQADGVALWRAGKVDAYAAPRSTLKALASDFPGSRVLSDAFGATRWAAFVPKGHQGRLAYIGEFLEAAKSSGLLAQFIARENLRGVTIVPHAR